MSSNRNWLDSMSKTGKSENSVDNVWDLLNVAKAHTTEPILFSNMGDVDEIQTFTHFNELVDHFDNRLFSSNNLDFKYSAHSSTLTSISNSLRADSIHSQFKCDDTKTISDTSSFYTDQLSSLSKQSKRKRKRRRIHSQGHAHRISTLPLTPSAVVSPSNKIIIPTETVIDLYKRKVIKFVSPLSNDLVKIEYFGSLVHFTPEQHSLLLKQREVESKIERIKRMKAAKERATLLSKYSAKYLYKRNQRIGKDTLAHINKIIQASVRGWIVRWKIRKLREATIKIQTWYRDMIPRFRFFKLYWKEFKEKIEDERKVVVVQKQLRWFSYFADCHKSVLGCSLLPIQLYLHGFTQKLKFNSLIQMIILTQSSMRRVLVVDCYEIQLLEEKLLYLKLSVLRRYEILNAPYSRRSLFCYKTRIISKRTYNIALKEYKYIESRKTLFMEKKTYHHHLQFVATQLLKHTENANLVKIVRNVFEDDIMKESKQNHISWKSLKIFIIRKKVKPNKLENSKEETESKENNTRPFTEKERKKEKLKLETIIVRMVPNMFSDRKGIARANWASLLVYSFVIHDLLTPNIQFEKNDINIKFMLDTKSSHKIPFNKI